MTQKDIQRIKRDGSIKALYEMISKDLWKISQQTEEASKDGFKKLKACITTIQQVTVEIDELYKSLEEVLYEQES